WSAPSGAAALWRRGACSAILEAPTGTAIFSGPVGAGPAGMHLEDCGVARLGEASEAHEHDIVRTAKDRLVVSRHGFCFPRRSYRARARLGTLRASHVGARADLALRQVQPARRRERSPGTRVGAAETDRSHALEVHMVRAEQRTAHDRRLRQQLSDCR